MRAKEYLKEYRMLCRQIDLLQNEIDAIVATIERAPDNDGMPRGFIAGDPTGEIATRLADLKVRHEQLIDYKWQRREAIANTIMRLRDPEHIALLQARYIDLKSWSDTAALIHVSENYARGRMHMAALIDLERILNE